MLFCCFQAFWGAIHRELLFLVKIGYLRKVHWNTHKVCLFFNVWKGENTEENLDLFKQMFLIKPVKGDKY